MPGSIIPCVFGILYSPNFLNRHAFVVEFDIRGYRKNLFNIILKSPSKMIRLTKEVL